jgi:hypothetical protein
MQTPNLTTLSKRDPIIQGEWNVDQHLSDKTLQSLTLEPELILTV